jgi:hypothetical protein
MLHEPTVIFAAIGFLLLLIMAQEEGTVKDRSGTLRRCRAGSPARWPSWAIRRGTRRVKKL